MIAGNLGRLVDSRGWADRRAHAQQPGRQALPVTVNGKRIKTIDVHAHCRFHEAVNLMGEDAKDVVTQTRGAAQRTAQSPHAFVADRTRVKATAK